ncbi:MAG: RluA family pseudouridine synthase [Lachnospiraceae bacterium]|nr:RluA family pseudouridine synthase [Lachnospiraceae bacterium]
MERILTYHISSEHTGKTILEYLRQMGYSHQNVTALKKMPESILLGGVWEYVSHPLKAGDELTIHIQETGENDKILPIDQPLPIVYEDEDLLIVDKPADMPTHPSMHHYDNTLANAVAYYYSKQGIPFVFRCINRLDRDTTGLTVIAKHMLSAGILSGMAAKREIHREYLALVHEDRLGVLPSHGVVDAPIARTGDSIILRCVDFERGERAVTHYEVMQRKDGYALVSLVLETGRTHQIRVHMKYLGHPLLGDSLYGGPLDQIGRQALHSHKLAFCHPITKKPLSFTAGLPSDMQRLVT